MRQPPYANVILLGLIVLLALALRVGWYTGPIGSDDNSYCIGAYETYDGAYHPADNYWKTRYGMLLPMAAFYTVFGPGEFSGALWPMLCSLGAVIVCFLLGKSFIDEQTGLLAALLLAFYPLDIHYSGLILPDVPLSFLMAASVLVFLHANRSEKHASLLFFVSGLLLAVAYSCRSMAVILLPFFLVYIVFFERKFRWSYTLFAAGFLVVILSECAYFLSEGLSPLHNFNLNIEKTISGHTSGRYPMNQAYYAVAVFRNLTVFGAYFFLFLPAMVFSLVKRQRGPLIFLVWAGIILIVLQFGFVSVFPPLPILKVRKFLNFATVPLIMLAAWTLMQLKTRTRLVALIMLVGSSLFLIWPYRYSANRTPEAVGGNMRTVSAYINTLSPKPIYADTRTQSMLRIVSSFEMKPEQFRDLYDVSSPYELKNCYVIINKFYAQFDQTNPFANVPRFVANYPMEIPGAWKGRDFFQSAVYEVP